MTDWRGADRRIQTLLGFAAVAIAFAAADTYVVVLALPEMMTSTGLSIDQLHRAAPIISGFLLGYVGILPLIGRISDIRGRVPVLVGSLVVFAIGSIVTAAAYNLESMVAGRLIQGIGGGGLIPPTLALVADLWPPARRGLPLGVVGAVQELGSVIGPLYGALILAFGGWRTIFWVNCAVALVLAAAILQLRSTADTGPVQSMARRSGPTDWPGALLAIAFITGSAIVMLEPDELATGVTTGLAFIPVAGDSRWLTPLALTTFAIGSLFIIRQRVARYPLVEWRAWPAIGRATDLAGSALLAVALGAVIVTFASANPESSDVSDDAVWLLPIAAMASAGFLWRQRTARHPLIPRGALSSRPAYSSLIVSFFIGASLIAALVDIPFFARITIYRDSQLDAALVLLRFLVALPVGAVVGGWLLRRFSPALLTFAGMMMSAAAFLHMATWQQDALTHPWTTFTLVVAGFGFGLAIAPVNAVLLQYTADAVHGVASGLLIVARMVGMLIGISVLTTIGLKAFYAASEKIPDVTTLCNGEAIACDAYRDALLDAGIAQLHAVFVGAALSAAIAGGLAIWLMRPKR